MRLCLLQERNKLEQVGQRDRELMKGLGCVVYKKLRGQFAQTVKENAMGC